MEKTSKKVVTYCGNGASIYNEWRCAAKKERYGKFLIGEKGMKRASKKSVVLSILVVLMLSLCSGCRGLMLSCIYGSALVGGAMGGVIGYQSGEALAGALIGAGILGTGELLKQTDQLAQQEEREKCREEGAEKVVVEVTNSNGSITPVELKKKGCAYIGPNGERYDELPSEEQLRPVYGF